MSADTAPTVNVVVVPDEPASAAVITVRGFNPFVGLLIALILGVGGLCLLPSTCQPEFTPPLTPEAASVVGSGLGSGEGTGTGTGTGSAEGSETTEGSAEGSL